MSSYSPRTPSRAQSAASGRDISSSASSSHQHFTSGIRLVPYTPPKVSSDNNSHRSSIGSQYSSANVVIEGETQLDIDEEDTAFKREFDVELQNEHFRPPQYSEDEDQFQHRIDDDSDSSEFETHQQQHQRRLDFYRHQGFLRPEKSSTDVNLSFAFSDDVDMGLDGGMESSEPSFRPISSSCQTSSILADETAPTEASLSTPSIDALGQARSTQVSGSSTPRPVSGNATPSTPVANRRPYKISTWVVSAGHNNSDDSPSEAVADYGDPPSLVQGASSSFRLDLPPLSLPPFAPSATPSVSRSRQSSFGSEVLRPSTAGGKKRRNQLMISSDGKTFSLAPLSPTTASSFAPAPLNAHTHFKAVSSEAHTISCSNHTRSDFNSSSQSLFNTVSPRPLPSTPVATSIYIPHTVNKSASTVAAIPIPSTKNNPTTSIRTISASANSVLSSSLDSSASSTIRPVFDASNISSSTFSASTSVSRSASSLRRYSDDASFADTRATTPCDSLLLSPIYSYSTKTKAAVTALEAVEAGTQASPPPSAASTWSRMIGGLRPVPSTTLETKTITTVAITQPPVTIARFSVDHFAVDIESPVSDSGSSPYKEALFVTKRASASSHNEANPELSYSIAPAEKNSVYPDLHMKSSFQSETTLSETSNYKVYARSSSPPIPEDDTISLAPSLDSNTNVQILGQSSPAASVADHEPLPDDLDVTITYSDDDENFIVHNVSSLPPSSSPPQSLPSSPIEPQQTQFSCDSDSTHTVQPEFSQESLRVQPLRPLVQVTPASRPLSACSEAIDLQNQENLRHAISVESLHSAFSFETAESLIATPAALYIRRASVFDLSNGQDLESAIIPARSFHSSMSQPASQWDDYGVGSSSFAGEFGIMPIQAHPHKWSDQLSTVMSETEPSSSTPHSPISRTGSIGSFANRRSAGYTSSANSRRMPSISSSVAVNLESGGSSSYWSHSRSNSASVERPTPTYQRSPGPTIINHLDEYGDGIGELNTLHSRPSRPRLGSMFSGVSSDRNLHSSSSSRTYRLNSASLPTWAKLYYGSGEHRPLPPPSEYSETDSRPASRLSRVASSDLLPLGRRKQRSNTHESVPSIRTPMSEADSGISQSQSTQSHHFSIRAQIRKQTSSIWSPHLRQDRRAIMDRYSSMWDPPTLAWYSGSSFLSRRNIQVISFILGFVFPFAWMIAAFLPLPVASSPEKIMEEGRHSSGDVSHSNDNIVMSQIHADEAYHLRMLEGARWWRRLNRYMSFVGLLVVGAVVALIIIGVQ